MAKFGKKNKVSTKLEDYNICLLGESGIGKTTLMKEVCEDLFGGDGYMIFNCGKEDGVSCLKDASYEDIDSYKKFDAVTKDVIQNKETDYPELKVIITDTLDQLFEIVEPEAVRRWNAENQGKKDFILAKTLNASWGGFGRGEEKVIEIILDRMWELKKVGVAFWSCGHVKTREVLDPLTGQTYTTLSTNMMQKYFNGIKTKMHVVGVACIDREIIKESTGRKNVVTKKEITKNKVISESRKIIFRDDDYGVDSKSRFSNIVDEIPLDKDEFIKALKEAVFNAGGKPVKNKENIKASILKEEKKSKEDAPFEEENLEIDDDIVGDDTELMEEVESDYPEDLIGVIRTMFKECSDPKTKAEVKGMIAEHGKLNNVPEIDLKKIYDVLK